MSILTTDERGLRFASSRLLVRSGSSTLTEIPDRYYKAAIAFFAIIKSSHAFNLSGRLRRR